MNLFLDHKTLTFTIYFGIVNETHILEFTCMFIYKILTYYDLVDARTLVGNDTHFIYIVSRSLDL